MHTAAKYVGDYLRDHEPDIVVLATPHGINISDSIGNNRIATRVFNVEDACGNEPFNISAFETIFTK